MSAPAAARSAKAVEVCILCVFWRVDSWVDEGCDDVKAMRPAQWMNARDRRSSCPEVVSLNEERRRRSLEVTRTEFLFWDASARGLDWSEGREGKRGKERKKETERKRGYGV